MVVLTWLIQTCISPAGLLALAACDPHVHQSDFLVRVRAVGLGSRHVVRRRSLGWSSSSNALAVSCCGAEDKQMAGGWCLEAAEGGDLYGKHLRRESCGWPEQLSHPLKQASEQVSKSTERCLHIEGELLMVQNKDQSNS